MSPPDENIMIQFVRSRAGACEALTPLAGDASMRRYFRAAASGRSVIVCYDETLPNTAEGEHDFLIMHELLMQNGVPVPQIISVERTSGLLLLEDLGDELLEGLYPRLSADEAEKLYGDILEMLVRIQSIPPDGSRVPFGRSFDMNKLMFEFDFFIEHAVRGHFSFNAAPSFLVELRAELLAVAEALQRPECFVLNHRDFHSRNIMFREGVPCIIDFQDARMGLPQYDLASLLRDSYLSLDGPLFERLLELYYLMAKESGVHSMGREEFGRLFDISAFQRNVKAIGTFAYQMRVLGRGRYGPFIDVTLKYLAAYAKRREELSAAYSLISECTERSS